MFHNFTVSVSSSVYPASTRPSQPNRTEGGTGPLSGAGAAALAWRVLLWVVLIGLLLEAEESAT